MWSSSSSSRRRPAESACSLIRPSAVASAACFVFLTVARCLLNLPCGQSSSTAVLAYTSGGALAVARGGIGNMAWQRGSKPAACTRGGPGRRAEGRSLLRGMHRGCLICRGMKKGGGGGRVRQGRGCASAAPEGGLSSARSCRRGGCRAVWEKESGVWEARLAGTCGWRSRCREKEAANEKVVG